MSHKALINGTGYDIYVGRANVDSTYYYILKGKTLINGTGYDINMYYGDVNNIVEMVAVVNYAQLYTVDSEGTTGTVSTGADAYNTWIDTYGTVTISSGSTYAYLSVRHSTGSSLNNYALFLKAGLYFKYANGISQLISNATLTSNLSGNIEAGFDLSNSGTAYYRYWALVGDETETEEGERTLTYPNDFGNPYVRVGIGRYKGSGRSTIGCTLYNATINGVTIPAKFEIASSLTSSEITFTINGTSYTCTRGMTWEDWDATTEGGAVISIDHDDFVQAGNGYLCKTGTSTPQESTDIIQSGGSYTGYDIELS